MGELLAVSEVLDEVESRIREQQAFTSIGSMEWRAHIADLAHVQAVRLARGLA